MIDPGRPRQANTVQGVCSSCSTPQRVYELDGGPVRMCLTCIGHVVDEAGALQDERARLYEGATWREWLECHDRHTEPTVGCPMCGSRP